VSSARLFQPVAMSVLLAILISPCAVAQQPAANAPKVSDQPLSKEQLAVYRALLTTYYEGKKGAFNLASQIEPFNPEEMGVYKSCLKGFDDSPAAPAIIHFIRAEDLTQLGGFKVHLVTPEKGGQEAADNDPEKQIGRPADVDKAVENGFAHGLLALQEILFDKTHTHAIVSLSFYCGRLCGHSMPLLMEKKDGKWVMKAQCGGWIS
jgi:hypothetical protein